MKQHKKAIDFYTDTFTHALRSNNPGLLPLTMNPSYLGINRELTGQTLVFINPVWGLRAFAEELIRIRDCNKCGTPAQVIDIYDRRPNPNHTNLVNYISGQCRVYGAIRANNDKAICELMYHYIQYNAGFPPYTRRLINRAIELAHHI